jgi:cyclohexanecarboxyl-CoA dehydrogenase
MTGVIDGTRAAGLSFAFGADREEFRRSIRAFARKELAPGYLARAKTEQFPWEQLRRLGELELLSFVLPERYGGLAEPDYIALGIAVEELSYADFNVANLQIVAGINGGLLASHASERVKEEWLPRIAAGEAIVALGLTEPSVGSDAGRLRTTARRTERGWVINGEKQSVTAAPFAQAAIVFARTGEELGARGVSAFLVPLDAPGVTTSSLLDTGFIPHGRGGINLEEVELEEDALVGPEGHAFGAIMAGFDFSRPCLGLSCIGVAQAAIDETVAYAKEREAFGSAIAKFEGVSFPLAEHATFLEAARWLCYRTLWMRQAGQPHTAQAAMCKWWGPKLAFDAIHDCLLLHGNVGYTQEHRMEQRLRDVMGLEIGDGTAQIQKIVIARELFGREFVPY